MTVTTEVLEWGQERARAGPWRGDGLVAYLAPLPQGPPPSPDFLRRCLHALAVKGYEEVITSALIGYEQRPFKAVGFEPRERLRLLVHDLARLPPAEPSPLRRATKSDWPDVLAVDAVSFSAFWRLDAGGLEEALAATPASRFRVAGDRRGEDVLGYAVTGRAGDEGYLQRLAVVPAARRAGIGRALALDGLRWLRRRGARRAVVNTQFGNDAAFNLYVALGFTVEPSDLAVLHRHLDP